MFLGLVQVLYFTICIAISTKFVALYDQITAFVLSGELPTE